MSVSGTCLAAMAAVVVVRATAATERGAAREEETK
jgi:hypothetical protein